MSAFVGSQNMTSRTKFHIFSCLKFKNIEIVKDYKIKINDMFAGRVEVTESLDSTNILTENDSNSVNSYQPLQEIEVSNYPRSTGSRRSRVQRQKVTNFLIIQGKCKSSGRSSANSNYSFQEFEFEECPKQEEFTPKRTVLTKENT